MQRSYCAPSHLFLIATAVVLSLWDSVVYLYHDESLVNKSLNILVLFLFSFQLLGQFFRAVCSGWQGFCLPPTPLPSWVDRGWPAPSLHSLWSAHWPVCLSHTHTQSAQSSPLLWLELWMRAQLGRLPVEHFVSQNGSTAHSLSTPMPFLSYLAQFVMVVN